MQPNTLNINDIIIREDLYPRMEIDAKKIQEYSENIDRLPPIVINQDNILIDGLHRIKAHKQAELKEIKAIKETTESDNVIFLRAIELNATHGLQLSYKDKKSLSIKLFDGKNAQRLQNALSISERTLSGWTQNKRKEMEKERNERIIELYLQCKTQLEIAGAVGVDDQTVANILKKIRETVKMPDFEPFIYNVWRTKATEDDNHTQFGFFPKIYMDNLIYYYTKPFDVVFDPFGGAGTTITTCKKWFRRYYVSDIKTTETTDTVGVKQHDITEGLPEDLPVIDFVFLDPPYWKQAKGEYTDLPTDFSNMELNVFYEKFVILVKSVKKKMRDGAYLAFVIQGTQWRNNLVLEDHAIRLYRILEDCGFKFEQRIILPYLSQVYNPQMVVKSKKEKIMLTLYRDLVVFKK